MKVGVYGATGYGGMQLITLLQRHPEVSLEFISSNSHSGIPLSNLYKKLTGRLSHILIDSEEAKARLESVDLIFLALPHGVSMSYVKEIIAINPHLKIIDLSGDFRIQNLQIYEEWYGFDHILKEKVPEFVYGLPELFREKIKKAQYIANPGCFPTSMILPLYPLMDQGVLEPRVIVDAKTGVSGAGRKAKEQFLFSEVQDNTYAYNTGRHRHSPEVVEIIRETTGKTMEFLFSPHIVPSSRGIYSTIYTTLREGVTPEEINAIYQTYYGNEAFIELTPFIPSTKDVNRSNRVFIHSFHDPLSKTLILFSTIDNLMKGASSQAIQNMNLMWGFDETLGIDTDYYYL
ncbi:MAG: hypothetical protein AVO33_07405 [delta proteobacterium ML8_F1]|nr:MAG: hypothetical protein AVO33_07405 [delta proteobacterium ML8_F1]